MSPRPIGFLSGLVSGGHAAVIFFFVLSGFILAYAHAGETDGSACDVKPIRFWRLRFARIAPAYYLSLLLALPIVTQFLAQSQNSDWSLAIGLASVMFLLQAWWPPYMSLWNFPARSLSVECVFYALFPWLARLLVRWPAAVVLAAAYTLVVLANTYEGEVVSWTQGLQGPVAPDRWSAPGFMPPLYLPLFVLGMALARLYLFGPALSARLHAAMLGIGVALIVLIFGGAWLLPSWTAAPPRWYPSLPWWCWRRRRVERRSAAYPSDLRPAGRGELLDLHPAHPPALLLGAAGRCGAGLQPATVAVFSPVSRVRRRRLRGDVPAGRNASASMDCRPARRLLGPGASTRPVLAQGVALDRRHEGAHAVAAQWHEGLGHLAAEALDVGHRLVAHAIGPGTSRCRRGSPGRRAGRCDPRRRRRDAAGTRPSRSLSARR